MGNNSYKQSKCTEETKPFLYNQENHAWDPRVKYDSYKCEPFSKLKGSSTNANSYKYSKVDDGYRERYEDTAKLTYSLDKDTWSRTVHK